MKTSVFGIRHHGPGSALRLEQALRRLSPDVLLIELPADGEKLLPIPAMDPPVSLLLYDPKDLKRAAYLPFAEFSPEWRALWYAQEHRIPVRFMDLPMELSFSLEPEPPEMETGHDRRGDAELERDPLGYLARLAGYTDRERWWESTFEHVNDSAELFAEILEMVRDLRKEAGEFRKDTLVREAYMREVIREEARNGRQVAAVVCGAWHAPVLENWDRFPAGKDRSLWKGIRKRKTAATWIPWSYERLAFQSGYGAGVASPAWYEILFRERGGAVEHWMSGAARLLRKEDLTASTAQVVDAVRLSSSLAAMRGLRITGIGELSDAAITVFAEGRSEPLELIRRKLIIGDKVGQVPADIPTVPLQQDFEATVKKARLSSARNTTEKVEKKLDLRKETQLQASLLLHRLAILNIPWGKRGSVSDLATGSFSEVWHLKWDPSFGIALIEAGVWGNTLEEAATVFLLTRAAEARELAVLTVSVEQCLLASLGRALPEILQALQDQVAVDADVWNLLGALPPLVRVLRYGSVRNFDDGVVRQILDHSLPRIGIGLAGICTRIDQDVAADLLPAIQAAHQAVCLLNDPTYMDSWINALKQLSSQKAIHPLLAGYATRILFDRDILSREESSNRFAFALSPANPKEHAVTWVEGFLQGSGLLLIHKAEFWQILDQWLLSLSEEHFQEVLPLLRRNFSRFPEGERQRMFELARRGSAPEKEKEGAVPEFDPGRMEAVVPVLRFLLG